MQDPIILNKEQCYEVIDRMEKSLKMLGSKGACKFVELSPRALALGMFVEVMNVANPPAKKVTKIEVKYETSN